MLRLGTKCPSMTSMWTRWAPPCSVSATCSPRRLKSAARIDGAMWTIAGSQIGFSLHFDDVDVIAAAAVGDEGKAPAVGGPGCEVVIARVIGDVALAGAVGIHDVDFVVAVAVGGEGDVPAVRRPDR